MANIIDWWDLNNVKTTINSEDVNVFVSTFNGNTNVKKVHIIAMNNDVTSMESFCDGCSNLEEFICSADASSVINMSYAWFNCYSLTSFPAIDTSNVTDMDGAWYNCYSLTSFPAINTSSITNMFCTWENCTSLTSFPAIDTSNVTDMGGAWYNCYSLTSFPAINTSSVTNMNYTWRECTSLTSFPAINTSSVINIGATWYNCRSLTSFPAINTSSVTDMNWAWGNCRSLTSFPVINTSSVIDISGAWYNCTSLTSILCLDNTATPTTTYTFYNCEGLTSFSGFTDCSKFTDDDTFTNTPLDPYTCEECSTIYPNSSMLNITIFDVSALTIYPNSNMLNITIFDVIFSTIYPNSSILNITIFDVNVSTIPVLVESSMLNITIFDVNLSTMPVYDGCFPLIKFTIFDVIVYPLDLKVKPSSSILIFIVNSHIVHSSNAEVMELTFEVMPPYFHSSIFKTVLPDNLSLTTYVTSQYFGEVESPILYLKNIIHNFSGQKEISASVTKNKVYAQSISLSLVPMYLVHSNDAYSQPQSILISVVNLQHSLWNRVMPETFEIEVNINSNIAQPYKGKRVISIDDITFDKGLYWSQNLAVNDYISTTATTINGNTVYSVAPLKQFTREYEISTKSDIIVEDIDLIKNLIDTEVHKVVFTDGSFEYIKFNLISNLMSIIPTHEGSNKYYFKLGVLV